MVQDKHLAPHGPNGPKPGGPDPTGPDPTGPDPTGPHPTGPHPSNMELPGRKLSKKKENEELERLFTEEDLKDTECGLGPCRSRWMQLLATKESLLVIFSLSAIVQGMFFSYTASVISTVEKRFKLTSKQSGIMLSGNDISAVLLAVFLGYYGSAGHRPRWLGLGLILAAFSSLVSSLPHLIYGSGLDARAFTSPNPVQLLANDSRNTNREELCLSRPDDLCETEDDGRESYVGPFVVLFLSQFLVGMSSSVFFSVGISFLDDNISKKTTSFYYSIYLLLRVLGPVLGFLLGGKCLSLWINPMLHPNLTDQDPRWLGAWWLGFVVIGGMFAVLGWIMSLYPRKLPATLRRQTKRLLKRTQGANLDPVSASGTSARPQQEKTSFKNLLVHLKRLLRNKVWMANLFNTIFAVLATSGYKIFNPKYLEHQFRKTASQANYYTGLSTMVATSLGTIISAVVLRWVRPRAKFVTGYNIFVTLLNCVCYIGLMFIGCPDVTIVGPVNGGSVDEQVDDWSRCWGTCDCSERFSPVCVQDLSTVFYSPCYAGCTLANASDTSHMVYSECRCITTKDTTTNVTILDSPESVSLLGSATQGFCPEDCNNLVYYLLIQIIMDMAFSTGKIGTVIIQLRSIADEDKGLSIGVQEVVLALFSFIPAPVIMGAIMDSSCVAWNTSCGRQGNCWIYDSSRLRMITHLVPAGLILVSLIGDIVIYHYSHLLDLYGEKEQQVETGHSNEMEMEDAKQEMGSGAFP